MTVNLKIGFIVIIILAILIIRGIFSGNGNDNSAKSNNSKEF